MLCLLEQNKNEEAAKTYNKLEKLAPLSAGTLVQMSYYLMLTEQHQKAEYLIQKAIQQEPENHLFKTKLAQFFLEIGNYEKAVKVLEDILSDLPDNRYAKKLLLEALLISNRKRMPGNRLMPCRKRKKKTLIFNFLKGSTSSTILNTMLHYHNFKKYWSRSRIIL